MDVEQTTIPEVLVLNPRVFADARGFFMESYNQRTLRDQAGIDTVFVQDNHSRSVKGTLRGLHYQIDHAQAKLVRVIEGSVFDVAVDLRRGSSTFGQWTGLELSADNKKMLWVPEGFAHGFLVLSDTAEVLYKTNDFYSPKDERCVIWNDPTVGIEWPLESEPVLSPKDEQGLLLDAAEFFE